jgi:hypothetical protein
VLLLLPARLIPDAVEERFQLFDVGSVGLNLVALLYTASLGVPQKTLGKSFAECHPRQSLLGLNLDGKQLFAECFLSGTRQSLCRVLSRPSAKKKHSAKFEMKKPEKNSKKFFNRGRPPPAKSPHLLRKIRALRALARFEPATSPLRVPSSSTAPHCHLCLNSVLVPHILY